MQRPARRRLRLPRLAPRLSGSTQDPDGGGAGESLGDDLESADLRITLLSDYLVALLESGDVGDLDDLVARAMVTTKRFGTARASYVPFWAAHIHHCQGNWDEALRYVGMVDPDGPVGNRARDIAVQILLRRDERELAEAHLRAAGLPADDDDLRLSELAVVFRVSLSLRAQTDGDLSRALSLRSPEPFEPHVG